MKKIYFLLICLGMNAATLAATYKSYDEFEKAFNDPNGKGAVYTIRDQIKVLDNLNEKTTGDLEKWIFDDKKNYRTRFSKLLTDNLFCLEPCDPALVQRIIDLLIDEAYDQNNVARNRAYLVDLF